MSIAEIGFGQIVSYEIGDSSGGQLNRHSTVNDIKNFNFDLLNPTVGPIYIKDARPWDTLEMLLLRYNDEKYSNRIKSSVK